MPRILGSSLKLSLVNVTALPLLRMINVILNSFLSIGTITFFDWFSDLLTHSLAYLDPRIHRAWLKVRIFAVRRRKQFSYLSNNT